MKTSRRGKRPDSLLIEMFQSDLFFLKLYGVTQGATEWEGTHLQSFFIRLWALRVIFLGNSIISMPLRIMLYVFIGSEPENGGLQKERTFKYYTLFFTKRRMSSEYI